jgi:hypothetical protein
MPQTDMFISYMLALGLQRNDRLRRVLVVNPDESEQLKDRYKHVFSRSLDERKGIVFVPATFERFVDGSWKEAHCLVAEGLSLAQICRFAGAMP